MQSPETLKSLAKYASKKEALAAAEAKELADENFRNHRVGGALEEDVSEAEEVSNVARGG